MKVPFFDWAGYYRERAGDFARIMDETAGRGGFILQREVDEFEAGLARFIGVKHVVGISDATNAMLLGLRASALEPGSEVIIPSHCFVAAAQAVHFAGGINIPVELSADDWLVDPAAIEAAITPRTRAIMPVHVNGRTAPMEAILEIASRYKLEVFEDAAQAAGARLKGRGAGTFGRWGVYSFYPSKTLGCFGDAGALVTNDDDVADKVRRMRNHGAGPDKSIAIDINLWGTNARIDNIQAAILNYKLTYYDQAIARRREIAARYHEAFSGIGALHLPPPPDEGAHFDIFQNYELCTAQRDSLRQQLATNGIGTIVQWGGVGIHQFKGLGFTADLPRTDRFFRESLLLPMNHILTDEQVDLVIGAVVGFFEAHQ